MKFYQAGRNDGTFDAGIEAALQRILADPEFIYRGEPESPALAAGPDLSHQRPRARVPAVVLPVEQHSRRGTADRGDAGPAQESRPCSSSRFGG